jgi:peptide/nickel transport system permease protein
VAEAVALETPAIELKRVHKHRSPMGDAARTLSRKPIAVAGLAVVVGWLFIGLIAPALPLEDPNAVQLDRRLIGPSWSNVFGTDESGRDVLSRVIFASRVSVPAGILVILVTMTIGCVVGAVAGYFGGYVDSLIMRTCDAVLSFPSIILAMAIAAARGGPGLSNAMIAVILVLWPEYARVMRGQVLALKENDFVTAAQSVGSSRWRVLFRHIIPSTDAPIVVKATLDVGYAIVLTAGLQYWWCSTFPGLAIMSVVMALNFFGDGLRDALDPRRRGK